MKHSMHLKIHILSCNFSWLFSVTRVALTFTKSVHAFANLNFSEELLSFSEQIV